MRQNIITKDDNANATSKKQEKRMVKDCMFAVNADNQSAIMLSVSHSGKLRVYGWRGKRKIGK